jgi:hypothetical protein
MVLPVAEYPHSLGISVTAGYVYRGNAIPDLQGMFIYGDFGYGTMWWLRRDDAGVWQNGVLLDTDLAISSFGEDEAGELYVADYTGRVLRFEPSWKRALLFL